MASEDSYIASIHDLPDFLLGAVLGLAGRSAGPAVTLTCRRFRRLFYAETSLWRKYGVAPPGSLAPDDQVAWATAQAARLACVAPLVANISLVASECQLPPLVALLQPASLRGLALGWGTPRRHTALPDPADRAAAWSAALQRFPALTALELSCCPEEVTAVIPAAPRRLPALRRLALRLFDVPADLAAASAQLQRLAFLRLSAGGPLPAGPVLLQLTQLQHLAHLELDDNRWPREHPPLPLPPPSQCRALRSYDFACHGGIRVYQIGHALLLGCSFSPEGGGALTLHELKACDGLARAAGMAGLQAMLEPLLPGGLPGCRPASLELQSDCVYLAPLAPLPHERCPLLEHPAAPALLPGRASG